MSLPRRSSRRGSMRMGVALLQTIWLLCGASGAAAQQQSGAQQHKAGEIVLEPTSLSSPDSGEVKFELGTLFVPENRNDPKSRIIGVGFARFRGPQAGDAPPQFHMPGGPGNTLVGQLKADLRSLPGTLKTIQRYARVSDVILVDQRGWSERGDLLRFAKPLPPEPLDQPGSLSRTIAVTLAAAKDTVKEYASKGIDLRGYTVLECADDVYDLKKALGYDRIMLVGTSYGSQWSFAIMRRHPEIVARVLLSGVEPLNHGFDMPSHILSGLHRMWWEAEQDPKIQPYLPPGGLAAAAREVLNRFRRGPIQVKVEDEKTKQSQTVTIGLEDFQRSFLLLASNPANLLSMYYEHYDLLGKLMLRGRQSPRTEDVLIRQVIDSAQGVTPERLYLLRSDPGTDYLGGWNFEPDVASADVWPTEDEGDDFRTEIVSRIPVVFAHGDWDLNTPLENTLHIAAFFPNSRIIIGIRGGHGILEPIAQNDPQTFEKILQYLRTGAMDDLPAWVTLPKRQFNPPAFPPPGTGAR
jgi:pimeloyl-ACP methyl ester carboxylesterase